MQLRYSEGLVCLTQVQCERGSIKEQCLEAHLCTMLNTIDSSLRGTVTISKYHYLLPSLNRKQLHPGTSVEHRENQIALTKFSCCLLLHNWAQGDGDNILQKQSTTNSKEQSLKKACNV